jgi:hypothetical protein
LIYNCITASAYIHNNQNNHQIENLWDIHNTPSPHNTSLSDIKSNTIPYKKLYMVLFNTPMMYTLWLYQYYKVKAYKAMRGLRIRL